MQKKNPPIKKNKYVISGLSGKDSPGGQHPSELQRIIQLIIIGTLVLIAVVILVYLISGIFQDQNKPHTIAAKPDFNIQPFGKDVLVYDGMVLSCIDMNGANRWNFTLGLDADYWATKNMVVSWTGNQIYVFDRNGNTTFNDRLSGDSVRFARVGESFIAACVGQENDSVVYILNHEGVIQETISFPDLFVLDLGFFSQKEKLLWVLGIDLKSNVPITTVSTHDPGRMLMGRQELNNQLVYNLYTQDTLLMLVDTSQIRAFDYRCVQQENISPVLVYGWQMVDVRTVGKATYSLFQHMPQSNDSLYFSELKLVSNQNAQPIRLLSPCFASGLNDKGVYGFSTSTIYFAPYGSSTFKSTILNYQLTKFICMLDGGRAVLASGNEVFIQKLPE